MTVDVRASKTNGRDTRAVKGDCSEQITDGDPARESATEPVVTPAPRSGPSYVGVIAVTAVLSILYLVFIERFARNGIYWDDWTFVPIVDGAIHHHVDWTQLWQQHNENREFVPFLLVAGIGALSHLNTVVIAYVSAGMFILSFCLLIGSYRTFSEKPISVLQTLVLGVVWFSIIDTENALWAFQIAWYLVLLCTMAMFYVLGRRQVTAGALAAAGLLAGVASFSSLQGLLLWPVGLFCIFWRVRGGRRLWLSAGAWTAAWVGSMVAYFHGFDFSQSATGGGSTSYATHHLVDTGRYVLALIGNVFPTSSPELGLHEVLGAVLLIVTIVVVSVSMYSRRSSPILPLPAALVGFAVLFDLTVAVGRVSFGMAGAVVSTRYTMVNLLVVVALAVAVFAGSNVAPLHRRRSSHTSSVVAGILVGLLVLAQAIVSTDVGLQSARHWNSQIQKDDTVIAQLDRIPEPRRSALFDRWVFPNLHLATQAGWVAMVQEDQLGELAPHSAPAYVNSPLPTPPP